MALTDPLALLERPDKWYLGNAGMLLYAPPFPQHLEVPGFWDECHFGDLSVPRLLCVSFAVGEALGPPTDGRAGVPAGGAGVPARDQVGGAALRGRDQSLVARESLPAKEEAGAETRPTGYGMSDTAVRPIGENGGQGRPPHRAALEELQELTPVLQTWRWFPDRIEAQYVLSVRHGPGATQHIPAGLRLYETRRLGPDGTLYCDLRVEAMPDFPGAVLHTVAWTMRQKGSGERADSHGGFSWDSAALGYTQAAASRAHARGVEALALRISMSGTLPPTSVQATPAHGANLTPRLEYTPLWDSLKHGALSGEIVGQNVLGSVVYAGLHWRTELKPHAAKPFCLGVRVGVRDPRSGSRPLPGSAEAGVHTEPRKLDPALAWREFLALVPHFECSDAMLTRYYWYRWYGLRLNAVPAGGKYSAPAVTEGIAYFRGVITYSLMCHINECKWLADPALAQGCLRNHIAHQTRAGHFPGHIYGTYVNDKGFYHTDVGASVAALLLHHPSSEFCAEIFKPLLKLLAYYTKERDSEALSLFDVWDQYETGQEFTSRYFHADKKADLYGWEHKLRLKGVDVTHYTYQLAAMLRELAQTLGEVKEVRRLADLAERIKGAVRQLLWDNERQFFFDYGVPQKRRSPYWTAVGFYPLLGGLASAEQSRAVGRHLLSSEQGGTGKFTAPWPTPTVPDGDPHFEADPMWRGERANCPWNGRVWPMVDSHIVDVLGQLSAAEPQRYRPELARYLRRFVEMMHFEAGTGGPRAADNNLVGAKPCFARPVGEPLGAPTGGGRGGFQPPIGQRQDAAATKDLTRPNCFEHYHPFDGTGCEYRGIDDYMHSWVVDPLLKYAAGVRLTPAGPGLTHARLTVDPFPFGLTHLLLLNCHVHGHKLDVCYNRDRQGKDSPGYRVYLDGKLAFRAAGITPWEVEL